MVFGEYLFSDSTNWSPMARYLYTYNDDETLNEDLREMWNSNSNIWETDSRVSYSYSDDDLLLSTEDEDWINDAWLPLAKTEKTYNSNNLLAEKYSSLYDTLTSNWFLTYKLQYTYDTDGKLSNVLSEIYQNSQWVYLGELNYSYTTFGKIAETTEPLDTAGDGSLSGNRTLYTYDANENLTHTVRESIYPTTQSWRPVLQYNYINNTDGSMQSLTRQMNIGIDSTQWINFGRLSYFYVSPNNLREPEQLEFVLYPNPAKDVVYFQTDQRIISVVYKVVNLEGKIVLSGLLNSGVKTISTAKLTSGVYLIELRVGDKMGFARLVKE